MQLPSAAHRPWPVPSGSWILRMAWCDLAFLHWAVDPQRLRPHLPPGVELDLYEGQAWLGVVPFFMRDVAPRDAASGLARCCSRSPSPSHDRHWLRSYGRHDADGRLDRYDSRERDQLLEVDHSYALATLNDLSAALEKHKGQLDMNLSCEVRDMQSKFPVTSTLERELLFLQAHSTHHYAIIAAMCRMLELCAVVWLV